MDDEQVGIEPNSKDAITPRELAGLINEVPDPLRDANKFLGDAEAAQTYVDKIKSRPGGVVIRLSRLSRNAGDTQRCRDCPEHLTGGDIFLVRAEDPNDVDFGNEAALNMGFLTPSVKPESQLHGKVTMIRMTPMSIHQLEKHNNYDTSQYRNGVKIDPQEVLNVLRPSVVKSSTPNVPGPTPAGK